MSATGFNFCGAMSIVLKSRQLWGNSQFIAAVLSLALALCSWLLAPAEFNDFKAILNLFVSSLCLVFILSHPRAAWVIYLFSFVLFSVFPEAWPPLYPLVALVMALLVACRGYIWSASLGGCVLWYSGSTEPLEKNLLPTDWLAAVIWAILLMVAVSTGYVLFRASVQRKTLLSLWHRDLQYRRQELVKHLHGSVAGSLTSVVIHAETLKLEDDLSTDIKADLDLIVNETRAAMLEIRKLMLILSNGGQRATTKPTPVVQDLINEFKKILESHQFGVELIIEIFDNIFNDDSVVVLKEIFGELTSNIIKYADPKTVIVLKFSEELSHACLSITNKISDKVPEPRMSSELGLTTVFHLAQTVSGSVRVFRDSRTWTTEIRLPVTK